MHSSTYVLTIPKNSNYSITYQIEGEILITVTGQLSNSNWIAKPKLRELVDYYELNNDPEYYGSLFVEFNGPSKGDIISDKDIKKYIEHLSNYVADVKKYEKIENNKYTILFEDAYNDRENVGYFVSIINGTKYTQWMISASTPEYVESSGLKGWLLIHSHSDQLENVLTQYGKLLVLQKVKPHIYVACYAEGQESDAWIDSLLKKINKPKSGIDKVSIIRKLTEEDIILLD